MNILITAGGTSEKIDDVREITNHSTGRLGQQIADTFLIHGHSVVYVHAKTAVLPAAHEKLTLLPIQSTTDLEETLHTQFHEQRFDCIIHSAAVSDFSPEYALTEQQFIEQLSQELMIHSPIKSIDQVSSLIYDAIHPPQKKENEKKISSNTDTLLLFLKKNPKIISMLRKKQSQAVIVGFKLLVGVSEKELITVGKALLKKNSCDFVLANDLETITDTYHKGILIDSSGKIDQATTKKAIATMIVTHVEEKWRDRQQ